MAKYFYTATSLEGEPRTGTLEAEDERQLARALRQEGYILVSAHLEETKKRLEIFQSLTKVSLKEKLFFTRNLRLMIKAGISLPKALGILASQSENKRFQEIISRIKDEVTKGKKFSEVLKDYPDVFSDLFCSMVGVGEETGNLEEVLKNLTNQMERTYELKARVQGALIYPAVIIVAMLGIGIIMLVTVVPQLAETFEDLGIELPFATRLIITTASLVLDLWFLFPIAFIVLFLMIRKMLKSRGKSKVFDRIVLRIPVISLIIRETNIAYTARTLGALINSGVPIVRSLEIVSRTLNNYYFREAIAASAKEVKKGNRLSQALKPYSSIFSVTFSEMVAIGEETGETSNILEKIADFSEAEVESLTRNLSSVIEPVIMIIVGAAVGIFAVSMIQPMYSMLGSI